MWRCVDPGLIDVSEECIASIFRVETSASGELAKAFRTFIRIYSILKCERLRANITLTLHKALISSLMTHAFSASQLAKDTYLLKLQCLQNKVLRTTGNFRRCISVRNLHTGFNLPYAYDYITKLCRKQAEAIQNHENEHIRGIGQGEARHRK
jgi:hypothetical protein